MPQNDNARPTVSHLYPADVPLIVEHVRLLQDGGCDDAEPATPDIVHVHGCWRRQVAVKALRAHRRGARIVLTPHGGLEPWVVRQGRPGGKLAETLLWQRRLVESAYVVIAHGRMEAEALEALGWNPRVEVVRNAVVTNSITPEAMVQHTGEVYRKVMDSNTLALMSADARLLLRLLLKAGITGDRRWVAQRPPAVDERQWRLLLIYADHEHVRTIVDRGTRALGLSHPYIETSQVRSYLPTGYEVPRPEAHDAASLVAAMHRLPLLSLRHFTELDRLLRRDDSSDDRLCDTLGEHHLLKFLRRLLTVLTEQTGLDEGYLPAQPLDDRQTEDIRQRLTNHLRI